jgi:hypothetical protein
MYSIVIPFALAFPYHITHKIIASSGYLMWHDKKLGPSKKIKIMGPINLMLY